MGAFAATEPQSGPGEGSAPQASPAPPSTSPGEETPTPEVGPSKEPQDGGEATPSDEAYWKWLEQLDPDEAIRRNRRLAGKIGQVADQLARRRVTEEEATRRQREEQERLDRLLEEDPYAYREELKKVREEQQRTAATYGELDAVVQGLFQLLPPESQQKLSGKPYPAKTRAESYQMFLSDIVQELSGARVSAEVEKEVARRMQEVRRVAEKEALNNVRGSEETPDLGGGQPTPGALTQDEWDRHRSNAAWRKANRQRINDAISAGRVRY